MKFVAAAFASLVFFVLAAAPVNAANFGKQETINFLQDVKVTGADNQPLFLGYKTTTINFIAGLFITDDGYVFGLRSDHTKFIETSPEEIAKFQKAGFLPDPLPTYSLSALDYALGYSLWIILAVLGLFYLLKALRGKRAAVTAAPMQSSSP